MAKRTTTVKPIFSMKISELPAVALIYHAILSKTGELAPFTSKDQSIDQPWLDGFKTSINNVKKIVPAKTIIKETKNLTSKITTSSKTCVELGKELTYWLNNTFSGNPGTIDSFPIIEANDSMRSGDTEGLIEHIDTITEQITAHETELTTQGYPLSNKNDYQTLHDLLEGLNTEQEQQKNSSFLIVQTRLRSFVTPVTNTSGPYSVSTSFYIKTQTPKNTVPYYAQPSSTV